MQDTINAITVPRETERAQPCEKVDKVVYTQAIFEVQDTRNVSFSVKRKTNINKLIDDGRLSVYLQCAKGYQSFKNN